MGIENFTMDIPMKVEQAGRALSWGSDAKVRKMRK